METEHFIALKVAYAAFLNSIHWQLEMVVLEIQNRSVSVKFRYTRVF